MLVAAADISWYPTPKDEYMAITIGEENDVKLALKELGHGNCIHMQNIRKEKTKNDILEKLDLRKYQILSLCIRTERRNTIEIFKKKKKKNYSDQRILNFFDYALFHYLEPKLSQYLSPRHYALTDIVFQCDVDCRHTMKTKGLKCAKPDDMHTLADITAWANSHERSLRGVTELNYANDIQKDIRERYRR